MGLVRFWYALIVRYGRKAPEGPTIILTKLIGVEVRSMGILRNLYLYLLALCAFSLDFDSLVVRYLIWSCCAFSVRIACVWVRGLGECLTLKEICHV